LGVCKHFPDHLAVPIRKRLEVHKLKQSKAKYNIINLVKYLFLKNIKKSSRFRKVINLLLSFMWEMSLKSYSPFIPPRKKDNKNKNHVLAKTVGQ
jgi:hypothetical protein